MPADPQSQPLKVAQCLAGAAHGGAESFYTRLVCSLAEHNELQQHAFTRPDADRISALRAATVPVSTFRFGSDLNVMNNWRYRAALKHFAPDIVLTYMNRASKLTPRGDYQLVCRLGHFYNLKYYRHGDYWIGNTRGICDHLIAGGMPAERVFLIQNFADETPGKPLPRNSFDTPAEQPLIIAAGRLHRNKGFDILLRALAMIPDCYLWLAGTGPEEQALKQLADALNITPRVRFLGWRNDIASLMATGDVFVCPSRHEGLGSIVLEAWAHGCPIVSTASQGPSELIEHGSNGLLSAIDDVPALRDNMLAAIDSPDLRSSMRDRAKTDYNKGFSKQAITRQYLDFFHQIRR